MYCMACGMKRGLVSGKFRRGERNKIVRALQKEEVKMAGVTVR